jgi:hypothetical protein
MSTQSYAPRYSAVGHPIALLKKKAKKLASSSTSGKVKHRDALDQVAREAGFSSWDELMANPDPVRDQFYSDVFSAKDTFRSDRKYRDFLSERGISDNSEAFRKYAVEMLKGYQELGFHNLARNRNQVPEDVLLSELHQHLEKRGAAGFLPQNLPSFLLTALIDEFTVFNELNETGPADSDDASIAGNLFVFLTLKSYQLHLKGKSGRRFTVPENEFFPALHAYHMAAYMEEVSRRTEIEVAPVTVDNVFSDKRDVLIRKRK